MPASLEMTTKKWGTYLVIAVAVLAALWFVNNQYQSANETETAQNTAVSKAVTGVAKSENPFQAENPLSNVEADPFEKTKKILNPFE